MVADEEQKRLVADKAPRAVDCVTVAQRLALLDELEALGMRAGRAKEASIARTHHHADFLHPDWRISSMMMRRAVWARHRGPRGLERESAGFCRRR
jgi:hypothetical protein